MAIFQVITLAGRPGEWTKRETGQRVTNCSCALLPGSCDQASTVSCIVKHLGPVHTYPYSFENATFFLRLQNKFASTQSFLASFSPVHTYTMNRFENDNLPNCSCLTHRRSHIMRPRNNKLALSLKFFGVGFYCCDVLQSHRNSLKCQNQGKNKDKLKAGAHQMEPPSPIQALGDNSFPSRFIIGTVRRGDFARRQWEEPITTTKWQCYCTSSYSRKYGVDRPNTIIS